MLLRICQAEGSGGLVQLLHEIVVAIAAMHACSSFHQSPSELL